jgi:alkylresorcinol/alkylpyrone synthase
VEAFLGRHEATVSDIAFWAIHPGGPRVVEAIAAALELSDTALEASWDVWERCGNVSSASVLHVLQELLDSDPPAPGSLGMLLAPGPGLSCEMVLLRAPATALRPVPREP